MSQQEDEKSRAYCMAAMAVTAHEFHIAVRQLSIDVAVTSGGGGASLQPLSEWCDLDCEFTFWECNLVEDYLVVLVSGMVGKLIWMESQRAPVSLVFEGARLEWTCLSEVLKCQARETDSAFAIAFGHLKRVDGGDPNATLYRIWFRANRLLHEPRRRERVVRLARRLMEVRNMTGEEVGKFLDQECSA